MARFMSRLALAWLVVACLPLGCDTAPESDFVTELPGSEAQLSQYLAANMLQEAAWECTKLEQYDRADSVTMKLEELLRSQPTEIKRWAGKGIMQNYLLTFRNDIRGFFKVAGSDSLGPIRNELAAYEIDRLLRLHLTPVTLIRDLTLPDGQTVKGVIKYYVKDAATAEDLGLLSESKPDILLFYDTVIANADRHLGNWMVRDDTKELFAIDHNRTFQFEHEWTWYKRMRTIRDPRSLGSAYERYKTLSEKTFRSALSPHLSAETIKRFLETRSIVLRFFANSIDDQTSTPYRSLGDLVNG